MLVMQSSANPQAECVLVLQDSLYDPFRRHDAYGCMGQGPLPLRESVRLALAAVFVLPVKVRPPDAACETLRWPKSDCLQFLHCCSSDSVRSPACAVYICLALHRACLEVVAVGLLQTPVLPLASIQHVCVNLHHSAAQHRLPAHACMNTPEQRSLDACR